MLRQKLDLKNTSKMATKMHKKHIKNGLSLWGHKSITDYIGRPYGGFRCTHCCCFFMQKGFNHEEKEGARKFLLERVSVVIKSGFVIGVIICG
jgi:hypothetical protein